MENRRYQLIGYTFKPKSMFKKYIVDHHETRTQVRKKDVKATLLVDLVLAMARNQGGICFRPLNFIEKFVLFYPTLALLARL